MKKKITNEREIKEIQSRIDSNRLESKVQCFPTSCTTGRKIEIFPSIEFSSTKKRANDEGETEDDDEIVLSLEKLANSITSVAGRSNGSSDFGGATRRRKKTESEPESRRRINDVPPSFPGEKLPRSRNDGQKRIFYVLCVFFRDRRGEGRGREGEILFVLVPLLSEESFIREILFDFFG